MPGSPARQLILLAAGLLVASSLIVMTTGFLAVSVILAGAGLFFSPVMTVAYIAAHTAGGDHQQNAATTWVKTTWVDTSLNVGGAAGSALAGVLMQAAGIPTAIFCIVIAAAVLLATSAVLARREVRG